MVPLHRHKTYTWGDVHSANWCRVDVWYQRHRSERFDDVEEFPEDNGFVYSVAYFDRNGKMHREEYHR